MTDAAVTAHVQSQERGVQLFQIEPARSGEVHAAIKVWFKRVSIANGVRRGYDKVKASLRQNAAESEEIILAAGNPCFGTEFDHGQATSLAQQFQLVAAGGKICLNTVPFTHTELHVVRYANLIQAQLRRPEQLLLHRGTAVGRVRRVYVVIAAEHALPPCGRCLSDGILRPFISIITEKPLKENRENFFNSNMSFVQY